MNFRIIAICAAIAMAAAGCRTPMPPGAATSGLRLGPLFETATDGEGSRLVAVRPFYSLESSGGEGLSSRREDDILWPLGIRSRRDDHYYWRALLFYGTGVDDDATSPEDPWRFRLFPLIYAGRTQEGEDYGAFFPFYGTIRDFLVFHETKFVLFPIYAEGRSPTGTEMRTVLWPFYLTRHGERIDQFRLWPFYGSEERRNLHTTRRNRFIAWPFWNDTSSEGEIEGSGFVLFPIYGHSRHTRRKRGVEESWSVIPPFFQYGRGDDGYRRILAPWPFVRVLDNDGVRERHFWPAYGHSQRFSPPGDGAGGIPEMDREYLLWPFISRTETERDGIRSRVLHLPMPFYFHRETVWPASDAADGDTDGGGSGAHARRISYSRLWPMFSRRAIDDEACFVRVPELSLWSKSEQVERNWAPLWSLYTYRSKPSGAYCNDLLWGLLSWGRNDDGGMILSLLWITLAK